MLGNIFVIEGMKTIHLLINHYLFMISMWIRKDCDEQNKSKLHMHNLYLNAWRNETSFSIYRVINMILQMRSGQHTFIIHNQTQGTVWWKETT
jgi:hypothetical protein